MAEINWKLKEKIVDTCGAQADFARLMKLDDTYVSKVIRGRRFLDETTKEAWAKALGCEVWDLWGDDL
jgi:transcriptional regulator with XRE-family HTH domain